MTKCVKRILIALLVCALLPLPEAAAQGVPDCQRVKMSYKDDTQQNQSVVRQWTVETANADVNETLNGILSGYRAEYADTLEKAGNKTTKSSRLDLDIRYSLTGDSWISFLMTARITYHRQFMKTEFVSKTFDMESGEEITLSDIFGNDASVWDFLRNEAKRQISAYFPDMDPDADALNDAIAHIETTAFTLHPMSMVLHFSADDFYPGRHTLIEVTLMYPDIWHGMTDDAARQTDNSDKKMIAFTYDDGPMRTQTTRLLNKLKELGVRGTFFVIGNRIEGEMDLVQREHDEGHAIAAHNWTHADVTKVSAKTIRTYRDKFDTALIKAIGIPSRYDRVPYGLYPQMVKAQAGWPYIQWSLDTYDWRGRSANNILSKIKKEATDGDIVLFHDIKDLSADIAGKVIPYLLEEGFMLVTIDELFARDGVTLENEQVYYRCIDGDTSRK